jgi:hypothetical protein
MRATPAGLLLVLLLQTAFVPEYCLAAWSLNGDSSTTPKPSNEVWKHWSEQIFDSPNEFWAVNDRANFHNFLAELPLSPDLQGRLTAAFTKREQLSALDQNDLISFYSTRFAKALQSDEPLIRIDPSLKAELEKQPAALEKIYSYLLEKGDGPPHREFADAASATAFLGGHAGQDGNLVPKMESRKHFGFLPLREEHKVFFFSPTSWKQLPEQAKKDFYDSYASFAFDPDRPGLKMPREYSEMVRMSYQTDADIQEIIDTFAFDRTAAEKSALRRYLELRRKRYGSDGTSWVPFNRILPRGLRKNLDTFTLCSGANCLNSVQNLWSEGKYQKKFSNAQELFHFLSGNFHALGPGEDLRPGDVLVYEDENGVVTHADYFLAQSKGGFGGGRDSFVYTKNGLTKISPYTLRNKSMIERMYFPNGQFRLAVFRANPGQGSPAHPPGKGPFPYYFDSVSPGIHSAGECARYFHDLPLPATP